AAARSLAAASSTSRRAGSEAILSLPLEGSESGVLWSKVGPSLSPRRSTAAARRISRLAPPMAPASSMAGNEFITNGATIDPVVSSGGTEETEGGIVSNVTVNDGGTLVVNGGTVSGMTLNAGAILDLEGVTSSGLTIGTSITVQLFAGAMTT